MSRHINEILVSNRVKQLVYASIATDNQGEFNVESYYLDDDVDMGDYIVTVACIRPPKDGMKAIETAKNKMLK